MFYYSAVSYTAGTCCKSTMSGTAYLFAPLRPSQPGANGRVTDDIWNHCYCWRRKERKEREAERRKSTFCVCLFDTGVAPGAERRFRMRKIWKEERRKEEACQVVETFPSALEVLIQHSAFNVVQQACYRVKRYFLPYFSQLATLTFGQRWSPSAIRRKHAESALCKTTHECLSPPEERPRMLAACLRKAL